MPKPAEEPSPESTDFRARTRALMQRHAATFIQTAASSIVEGLLKGKPGMVNVDKAPKELMELGACFVTLKKDGQLRGCIGSPEARRPLLIDVLENAYNAAFQDPRFPALNRDEWEKLTLSVSILSPQVQMDFEDEADLLDQLRPGEDGLVIADGRKRALFLPSVWEQLPDKNAFLSHLKAKAGMAADHWSETFKAYRFIALEARSDGMPNFPKT